MATRSRVFGGPPNTALEPSAPPRGRFADFTAPGGDYTTPEAVKKELQLARLLAELWLREPLKWGRVLAMPASRAGRMLRAEWLCPGSEARFSSLVWPPF